MNPFNMPVDKDLFNIAARKVMESITFPRGVSLDDVRGTVLHLDVIKARKLLPMVLKRDEWEWGWFDEWMGKFSRFGKMPCSWVDFEPDKDDAPITL